MKDKFFKFFEIGKLDKGLFRIWLILLIPYFIIGYLFIQENSAVVISHSYYKNFSYYKEAPKTNSFCHKIYIEKYKNLLSTDVEIVTMYGRDSTYGERYYTLEECLEETQKIKTSVGNKRIAQFSLFIFSPLFFAFIFLIFKKIILWIYRGFK